jgi:hypothetical protein
MSSGRDVSRIIVEEKCVHLQIVGCGRVYII